MKSLARLTLKMTALLAGMSLLAACASVNDLDRTPEPMGRFLLGHNIAVVAEDIEVLEGSRKVENDKIVLAVRSAINDRFSRYDGDRYFHIAVSVLNYNLADKGIPGVTLKSALVADVRLYDDSQGGKPLTEEPRQFFVLEEGGEVLLNTGNTRTPEEQLASLSRSLAKDIQEWMLENVEWFGDASLMDPATTSPGRPIQPLDGGEDA